MKKRKASNAKCATKAFFITMSWKDICHQFMEERSLSNVNCAKKAFLIKVIWLDTCHQFMKKRKFSNAKCVTRAFLKRLAWQDIWYQFMNRHVPRSKNLGGHMPDEGLKAFKCKLCDKSFSRKDKMTTHTVSNYEGLKAFRWKCVTKAFLKIVTWLEICHQLMKERKKIWNYFQE